MFHQANAYDVVRLTARNVHAVHPNETGDYIQRAFLKVTFSERDFNRSGNTINPNLNYRYMYVHRTAERNTQNYIGVVPAGYTEVDLRDIDFTNNRLPEWVDNEIFTACKSGVPVLARPAREGQVLQTVVNGDVVTSNVAGVNNMKVTAPDGGDYFLGAKFNELYQKTAIPDMFVPTARNLAAVRVNRKISFIANWGTQQNIPEGGVIVQDKDGERWGVHPQSFAGTYRRKT